MILKNLTLKNIRSFETLNLNLSEGISILSGDIGSGKTTILIAIEFALFGILRGKISPSELLRHGTNEGFVNLHFSVTNSVKEQDIIITRFLKRTNNGIIQPAGKLLIDGQEVEFVATELKSKILELLGYPASLINKSTNLFRYTVYTPQEQVKAILFETEEERKDVIRKIFALDKYKNIISNSQYYQTYLRSVIDKSLGEIENLTNLQKQKTVKENEIEFLKKTVETETKTFEEKHKLKLDVEKKLKELQKKQDEIFKQKQKIDFSKQKITQINNSITSLIQQQKSIDEKIKKIIIKDVEFDKTKKQQLLDSIIEWEDKKSKFARKHGEISAKKQQLQQLKTSILNLDECPTCKQIVSKDHKEHISLIQETELNKLLENEKTIKEFEEKVNSNILKLKKSLEKNTLLELEFNKTIQNKQIIDSLKEQLNSVDENVIEQRKRLVEEEKIHNKLIESLELNAVIDLTKDKIEFEKIQREERLIELELKSNQTRLEITKKTLSEIVSEIDAKQKLKERINKLNSVKSWFNDLFVPLLDSIERKIMSKIYQEFNSLFVEWFTTLIEDSTIEVKLDENFTPIIEQNGFDTNIENLSGGEKTSLALAYRLSLNKVLNDYFSKLHTKDLLILDEPTDGFSTEQLDKLSLVLNQLNAKQIIIVSHEQKLESIAENIIHIDKNNHSSFIVIN